MAFVLWLSAAKVQQLFGVRKKLTKKGEKNLSVPKKCCNFVADFVRVRDMRRCKRYII